MPVGLSFNAFARAPIPLSQAELCAFRFGLLEHRAHYGRAANRDFLTSINEKEFIDRFRYGERTGDPHIALLKQLGVRIKNGKIKGSPGEVGAGIDKMMDDLVASGRIAEDDALRPGRVHLSDDQTRMVVDSFHEKPIGFNELHADALDDDQFWAVIEEGYIPFSRPDVEANYEGRSLLNGLMHDTAHASGLMADLGYMKSVRQAARYINSLPPEAKRQAMSRGLIVTELLAVMPRRASQEISSVFWKFKIFDRYGKLPPLSKLNDQLAQQTPKQIRLIVDDLLKRVPDVEYLGGTVRDPLVRTRVFRGEMGNWEDFDEYSLLRELRQIRSHVASEPESAYWNERLRNVLVQTIRDLHVMKDETPAKIVDDIIKGNKESPFYRTYCRPGSTRRQTNEQWCHQR